jgi:hypothetical protein
VPLIRSKAEGWTKSCQLNRQLGHLPNVKMMDARVAWGEAQNNVDDLVSAAREP